MKNAVSRHLPQIIIIAVIVGVGVVILLKALGGTSAKNPTEGLRNPAGAAIAQIASNEERGARTVAVRASTVALGSIGNYTKLQGDVVSYKEIKIYPNIAGKLLKRNVEVGDLVSVGTTLAYVDPSKVGETYMPNPVESTVSGTVISLPVHEGDTITTSTVIAVVGDTARTKVRTAVPERFLANLRVGNRAEISFDAIPGVIYTAKISEMDPVLDASTRTRQISLVLDRHDPKVLVGMSATVKLVTEERNNVVLAPRSAVTNDDTESYVFVVKSDNTVEKRKVVLGLEGEDAFEVKEGLSAGEQVVTEGKNSVTHGSKVKIVDGSSTTTTGASE
jgi:multidrug efflux pump subunit AcrA (membrane-fusion protein)